MFNPDVANRKFTVSSSSLSFAPLTAWAITVPCAGPNPGRNPRIAPVIPPAKILLNFGFNVVLRDDNRSIEETLKIVEEKLKLKE